MISVSSFSSLLQDQQQHLVHFCTPSCNFWSARIINFLKLNAFQSFRLCSVMVVLRLLLCNIEIVSWLIKPHAAETWAGGGGYGRPSACSCCWRSCSFLSRLSTASTHPFKPSVPNLTPCKHCSFLLVFNPLQHVASSMKWLEEPFLKPPFGVQSRMRP